MAELHGGYPVTQQANKSSELASKVKHSGPICVTCQDGSDIFFSGANWLVTTLILLEFLMNVFFGQFWEVTHRNEILGSKWKLPVNWIKNKKKKYSELEVPTKHFQIKKKPTRKIWTPQVCSVGFWKKLQIFVPVFIELLWWPPGVWTCGVCGAMPGAEEAKPGAEEAKPGVEAELQKSYSVQLHDGYIQLYIFINIHTNIFRGWHVYIYICIRICM